MAAARAAAARPGEYSVLMLYGDTGTGKTHLLQAIAHEAHRSMPSRRVIVTDARRFVQEFSAAHLAHDLDRFRRRYAEADILAVDDFHVLAEGQKNASAAEFLTIFDHFAHDGPGRQIVLASSRAIENLEGLPEGLRNRLQAGLTVHLAFPDDPDAAVRLIRAKAGARGVSVPREAARIIAEGTPPNARALEGAVGRLCALTQLEGLPMGAQTARLALDAASGQADGRALTLDDVARAVSDASRVSLEDLRGRGRTRSVRMARQLAATLARRLTRASLAEMGRYFDNRTHATVLSLLRGAKPGWWKDRVMGHMTEQALRLLGRREPVPDLFPEQGELPFPEP